MISARSISIVLLGAALLAGCRQVDIRTVTFQVPQVFNQACEQRVRQALRDLKGIDHESMAFDLVAGTVVIKYDSMLLANKNIEHKVIAAGFDINELKASPAARAALPAECLPAGGAQGVEGADNSVDAP